MRQSTVRPVCAWLAFECSLCLAVQSVRQPYGYLQEPMTCLNQGRDLMEHKRYMNSLTLLCNFSFIHLGVIDLALLHEIHYPTIWMQISWNGSQHPFFLPSFNISLMSVLGFGIPTTGICKEIISFLVSC